MHQNIFPFLSMSIPDFFHIKVWPLKWFPFCHFIFSLLLKGEEVLFLFNFYRCFIFRMYYSSFFTPKSRSCGYNIKDKIVILNDQSSFIRFPLDTRQMLHKIFASHQCQKHADSCIFPECNNYGITRRIFLNSISSVYSLPCQFQFNSKL